MSRKVCAGTILLSAGYFLTFSLAIAAQGATETTKSATTIPQPAAVTKPPVAHRSTVRSSVPPAPAPRSTVSRRSSAKRRVASRRVRSRQRLARLRLEPSRVKEIQQALAREGYLKQEPNGSWDALTRDAMRRYQADHGFSTTGMPEAKSLLKLGLGPHPLPAGLETTGQPQPPASEGAPSDPNPPEAGTATNQVSPSVTSSQPQ